MRKFKSESNLPSYDFFKCYLYGITSPSFCRFVVKPEKLAVHEIWDNLGIPMKQIPFASHVPSFFKLWVGLVGSVFVNFFDLSNLYNGSFLPLQFSESNFDGTLQYARNKRIQVSMEYYIY
jgi:hypothetical protein